MKAAHEQNDASAQQALAIGPLAAAICAGRKLRFRRMFFGHRHQDSRKDGGEMKWQTSV